MDDASIELIWRTPMMRSASAKQPLFASIALATWISLPPRRIADRQLIDNDGFDACARTPCPRRVIL
jgi:hypothetical protein